MSTGMDDVLAGINRATRTNMSNASNVIRRETLRREIQSDFDAIARGEFEEHDRKTTKALAAEIKRRGKQCLIELRKRRKV